ncbi:MAG: hypothetical protein IPM58_09605 [Nitrospira sp.]|nr:hypothetical protein [Nitrospira sp.]
MLAGAPRARARRAPPGRRRGAASGARAHPCAIGAQLRQVNHVSAEGLLHRVGDREGTAALGGEAATPPRQPLPTSSWPARWTTATSMPKRVIKATTPCGTESSLP